METIKWGIIGAGNISSTFATALNSLENTKLVAVAARDFNRAKEFALQFQVEKAYGSYEELARDSEIDVVYIGTPHTEHLANAKLCIRNQKAVLCEKPFTLNCKQSEYLIRLAKEKQVFLMEAMWTKFLPVTRKVKEWISDKRIGDPKHFKISFGFYAEFQREHRLFHPKLGGGALLDVGIYPITYVVHLLGKLPDSIISSAVIGKTGVDDQNVIILKYNEGILCDLSSAISAEIGKDAVIVGDKGRIVIPNFWAADKASLYDVDNNLVEYYSKPFAMNGYEYEAEEVNACLRDKKTESEIIPLANTIEIMKLMDQIRADWGLVYPQEQ